MKEHCKTCQHADLWEDTGSSPKVHPGIDGWCEYRGEDIEDMEEENWDNLLDNNVDGH